MQLEQLPRHARIKATNTLNLTLKVISELGDPLQFFEPGRLVDLLQKGSNHVKGITQPISDDTMEVQKKLEIKLHKGSIQGDTCYLADVAQIGAIVFSNKPKLYYVNYLREDHDTVPKDNISWYIVGPTHSSMGGRNANFPENGYIDHRRTINKFIRKTNPLQSLGGIFIDNGTGELELLNYDGLHQKKRLHLSNSQVLIGANWYMDSDNQTSVTQNETGLANFNGIGILTNSSTNESHTFAITSGGSSCDELRQYLKLSDNSSIPVSKRFVAAMCNILAQKYSCDSWKMCGLEYVGGGIFTKKSSTRDSFRVCQ